MVTLFTQRAGHRDTQAIQQKLDELLRAVPGARAELARIDQRHSEDIGAHHRREAGEGPQPLDRRPPAVRAQAQAQYGRS